MTDRTKKLLLGVGAVGAMAFGGAQLAGAQDGGSSGPSPAAQSEAAEAPGSEGGETREDGDRSEQADQVTGADAEKAKAAALAAAGGGKATDVSADSPGADEQADRPERGEKAEPTIESQTAYEVEVTKPDGSDLEVHLDKAFKVLGTEADDQQQGDHDSEQRSETATGAAR